MSTETKLSIELTSKEGDLLLSSLREREKVAAKLEQRYPKAYEAELLLLRRLIEELSQKARI